MSLVATVPLGNFLNASSVGANTVNGPAPFSVVVRFAAWTAATRVVNLPSATAVSRVVLTTGAAVVGTGVGTGVGVGVTTGAGGWDVQPAIRIPINRIARTTNNFFMHLFLLFRYISIFN